MNSGVCFSSPNLLEISHPYLRQEGSKTMVYQLFAEEKN
jgi:hypothetical protein